MVEQPKKTLTFSAMQYGIYMGVYLFILKSATPFPKCYLHKEEWTFDS